MSVNVLPSWFRNWREVREVAADLVFPQRMVFRALDSYLAALRALSAVELEQVQRERIEGYARLIEVQELGT